MRHTRESTLSYLKENNFPKVFIDLFEENSTPECFDILFSRPEELYLCSEEEQVGIIPKEYQPLWDDGNFGAIFCAIPDSNEIAKVYVEGGETKYESYNHFAAIALVRVWELEWDNLMNSFAQALEVDGRQKILSFIETNHEVMDYKDFELALKDYVAILNEENA
ncbi:MAG: hypothetical protein AB2608_15990 [Candidatus Thiodiazotropha sp.]